MNFVEEWAKCGTVKYYEAWSKLRQISAKNLKENCSSWHQSCYKKSTSLRYAKERELLGPNESRRKSSGMGQRSTSTQSQTSPLNKDACFFCDSQGGYRETLFNVRTLSGGYSLRRAVAMAGNKRLQVKLNTAIAANNAHAIDVKYHRNCWLTNVTNVLRKPTSSVESTPSFVYEIAAKIEFLAMTELTLRNGEIIYISDLQSAYELVREENNVDSTSVQKKALKQLLLNELSPYGIEFHRPKHANEPELVSLKKARDNAIRNAKQQADIEDDDVKVLFEAASVLRKAIKNCKKWEFTGTLMMPLMNMSPRFFTPSLGG